MYGIFPYRTWCILKEILWVGSDTNLCCVSVLCLEIAFFIIVWIWSGLIYKLMHMLSYLLIVMQMPQSTLGNASNICLLRCTHLSYTRSRMKIHKHRSLGLRVCLHMHWRYCAVEYIGTHCPLSLPWLWSVSTQFVSSPACGTAAEAAVEVLVQRSNHN